MVEVILLIKALVRIANELNRLNVKWGLGGSLLLFQYGLTEKAHDLDIMVELEDYKIADAVLSSLGTKLKNREEKSPVYLTEHFNEYVVDGIDIDLMAGFQISHEKGVYRYAFDELSTPESKWIDGIKINYTALEDWYVLYQLMSHGPLKANAIEHYLFKEGIKHPILLERALRGNLPESVKNRIEGLLYQSHPEYKVI
jgi:hypothetical protein